MNVDLTILPVYAQNTLKAHHAMIEWIWDGWCADIRGVGKLGQFVLSTMRTYHEQGRPIAKKTAQLITQYLLAYFTTEGQSNMRKIGHGFYGWEKVSD